MGVARRSKQKKKNVFLVFLFFFDFLRFLRQGPRFRAWEVFFLLTDWAISTPSQTQPNSTRHTQKKKKNWIPMAEAPFFGSVFRTPGLNAADGGRGCLCLVFQLILMISDDFRDCVFSIVTAPKGSKAKGG